MYFGMTVQSIRASAACEPEVSIGLIFLGVVVLANYIVQHV